jgi:hypothetical protein
MNCHISKLARMGVFALAMAFVPAVVPAAAQSNSTTNEGQSMSSDAMVPGTGLTMAELSDLGYSQQQIAAIRGTDFSQAGAADRSSPETTSNTNDATNPNSPQANKASSSGGGWGLWGLVGLLGLLGLARGRRAETIRKDRDADVRRIA